MTIHIRKGAFLSRDLLHRYRLTRTWDEGLGRCLFIMLNPSTADATKDDKTIRRCIRFTERFGMGKLVVVNLFSYRTPKPKVLLKVDRDTAVVPLNLEIVEQEVSGADLIVCAWGANGSHLGQNEVVLDAISRYPAYALGLTADGHPRHPLYLKSDAPLIPFNDACRISSL